MPKTIVIHRDGTREEFTLEKIIAAIRAVVKPVAPADEVETIVATILTSVQLKLPEEVTTSQFDEVVLKAIEQKISSDTIFDTIAAAQILKMVKADVEQRFATFEDYINYAVGEKLLSEKLLNFDFDRLHASLDDSRDGLYNYFGAATLADRYLLRDREQKTMEKAQWMWMRISMGLSLNEKDPTDFAIRAYDQMSSLKYLHSTPTLYNSGTPFSQLSSCYISVVGDDLTHIMNKANEMAQFVKYAGGVGMSVTKLRASGSSIKSINSISSGPIPFIKMYDVIKNGVSQNGRRRAGLVIYIEPWHYNIMEYLDLKEQNGSPYLRAHSINTALWIPDCFMERVKAGKDWWMLDPHECPELAETWGEEFTAYYDKYCEMAERGELKLAKKMPAKQLYDHMLFQLAKTGNNWLNFKDTHNRANQAPSYGNIHSSNLCTEISIPNNENSTAVCTLASLVLPRFLKQDERLGTEKVIGLSTEEKMQLIDWDTMRETIRVAIRALDNVIDLNFFPSEDAKRNSFDLRPIGLGFMGLAELYIDLGIAFDSPEAVELADKIGAFIQQLTLNASKELAEERGAFRDYNAEIYDYEPRRNALLMAIAPTASISLIAGTSSTVDPYFANVYSREVIRGKFTIIIHQLVNQLKAKGVWTEELKNKIIANQGSIQNIEELDGVIDKNLFKTSYETGWKAQIDVVSALQKHLDQSITRNMYIQEESRSEMDDVYMYAWEKGLKWTYYCFIEKKIQGEKYTQTVNKRGARKWFGARKGFATRRMGALQAGTEATSDDLKDIDFANITAEQKIAIRQKLIKDKGADYVKKLESGELYQNGACPVDPFEKVMCEACQ